MVVGFAGSRRRRGHAMGIVGGRTGAVPLVQGFGLAIDLHPHLNGFLPDDLWVADAPEGGRSGQSLRFEPQALRIGVRCPSEKCMIALLESSAYQLMKGIAMRRTVLVLGLLFLAATPMIPSAQAAAGEKPIQIALWNPVQIYPEETSIKGFRLSLLYGSNKDVKGLDLGIVSRTTGVCKGLQYGAVGIVGGEMYGWQAHWVNMTAVKMYGLQSGLFNQTAGGEGVQSGGSTSPTRSAGYRSVCTTRPRR